MASNFTSTSSPSGDTLALDEEADAMQSLWYVGVILETFSTMSGTVGKQLIRYSEIALENGNAARSRLAFGIGIVLNTAFGPIVDTSAYAFAPATLLAPFTGLDIVWNMLSAPFTLGEKLTPRRCISIVLIFAGTLGSVFPADHTEVVYTPEFVRDFFFSWRTLLYFLCFFAWLTVSFLCLLPQPSGSVPRGFALGATAGSIAGNMFCVKATAELIKTAITEGSFEVWTDWPPYLMLFGAILFAVSNVAFMTKGLLEYEALFMVTLYEGTQIVFNAISASVVLGELDGKGGLRIAWYVACIFTIVCALVLLLTGEKVQKSMLDEDSDEESSSREYEQRTSSEDEAE